MVSPDPAPHDVLISRPDPYALFITVLVESVIWTVQFAVCVRSAVSFVVPPPYGNDDAEG